MIRMIVPLVVIEAANPGATTHLDRSVAAARDAGLEIREGWHERPGIVCVGWVHAEDDARRALVAAVAGAGLIVTTSAPRLIIDRLVDDLGRLGRVTHVTPDAPAPPRLDADQRALLALLAEGLTLGAAAEQLGLSRRTADRRLAAAKRALGALRTADALVKARRLGSLSRSGSAGPERS